MNANDRLLPAEFSAPAPAVPFRSGNKPPRCVRRFLRLWRLEHPMCRAFLELGANPTDFETVKLLFPYVREASLLEAPYAPRSCAVDWLTIGFVAAHDLGCRHPELLESVLPGYEVELAKARLLLLKDHSDDERFTPGGLDRALRVILDKRLGSDGAKVTEQVLCELLLKTMRAGFATGTVAQIDPAHFEYVCEFSEPVGATLPGIVERSLIASLWRNHETGGKMPKHALLRLATELYPENSLTGKTILRTLRFELTHLRVCGEVECPTDDEDLLGWIAAGLAHGRDILHIHPRLLTRILDECIGPKLEAWRSVIYKVTSAASQNEPMSLLGPMQNWKIRTYGLPEPKFLGQDLAQVAYLFNLAMWIPWIGPIPV